jgi:hypothetical protein
MSKEIPKGPQKPQATRQTPPQTRKQGPPQGGPPSPSPRQQINPVNAQVKNANLTQSVLWTQVHHAMMTIAKNILALQKENTELKAKLAEAQKKP